MHLHIYKFCLLIQSDWMIAAVLLLALLHIYVIHLMFQFVVAYCIFIYLFIRFLLFHTLLCLNLAVFSAKE